MTMDIKWSMSRDLSALHAAWCLQTFPNRVSHMPKELSEASEHLVRTSEGFAGMTPSIPVERFWEVLFATAVDAPQSQDLDSRALTKLCGSVTEHRQSELLSSVQSLKAAFDRIYPKYASEAPLRVGPLRQIWEAQGPGLLHLAGRFTDRELMVASARVIFVQPILGGWGFAHLATNSVHFEAVMTNELPMLPESLRLAWLLAQLDFERPIFSERIHRFQLRRIAGFSMIPPVLKAGEELGICTLSSDLVKLAVKEWQADLSTSSDALGEVLMTWWETYQSSRPDWPTALTALDRMVG